MRAFPSTTHVEGAVRDLPVSLPYHRLFGVHFVLDEDTGGSRRDARLRTRELEHGHCANR